MSRPASPAQIKYIRSLCSERASHFPHGVDAFMNVIQAKRLTGTGASGLIDRLLNTPADVKEGEPQRDPARRTNAYPGKCRKCGTEVAAKAGYLDKVGSQWVTEHVECPVVDPNAPEGKPVHRITEIVGDLSDGCYGVPSWTGETDVLFFSIATNKGFYRPEKKGQRIVKLVAGGGNDFPTNAETIEKFVKLVRAMGPIESMQMYSREMSVCARCGEDLSRALSKVTGFGPTCRNHLGYVVSDEERSEVKRLIEEAKARGEELLA